ncbi:MAG: 30S ribosomal protein S13 [Thermoplasmatales archaeon]
MAEKNEKNENIKYIVRLANTNLDGTKEAVYSLSTIRGIGYRTAEIMLKKMDISPRMKLGEIEDEKLDEIKDVLERRFKDVYPSWAMNHRKDIQTGDDLLKVGPEWDVAVLDDVNRMKRIRSYKGIRHEKGKKVRGQRTRSNGRKGLAVGVVKRREAPSEAGQQKEAEKK